MWTNPPPHQKRLDAPRLLSHERTPTTFLPSSGYESGWTSPPPIPTPEKKRGGGEKVAFVYNHIFHLLSYDNTSRAPEHTPPRERC